MSRTAKEEALAAFLRRALHEPFVWGRQDCALWSASWIGEFRGTDPAAHFRGRYSTALGCSRLLKREGGLETIACRLAAISGLVATSSPEPGDVGIINTIIGPALTIRTASGWAWKAKRGVSIVPATAVVAWSV